MKYKIYRGTIILSIVLLIESFLNVSVFASEGLQSRGKILYFYSPTCSSCRIISEYLNALEDVEIIKFNIVEKQDKSLFNYLCDEYDIPIDKRTVPLIFAGDKWISGKSNIYDNLDDYIMGTENYTYPQKISGDNYHNDLKLIYSKNYFAIFVIGFINGLNPCSLAMIIFLITITVTKSKRRILPIAVSYILSKYLTFLLLGTVLYKCLSFIHIDKMQLYLKAVLILVIGILFIGNLLDYYNATKGMYGKIKLQLPRKIRSVNQSLIKNMQKYNHGVTMYLIVFFIGILISITEFLCTGQIYLVSIITIFQYVKNEIVKALFYLIIYNIGMVSPLFILSLIVYKGKHVLDISEKIVDKTSYIKLINLILLLVVFMVVIKLM